MLQGLKRLFGGAAAPVPGWDGLQDWVASRNGRLRTVQVDGFVVDGQAGTTPWRLEWGPSQRPYIQGQELRLRAELGLNPELQAVLMNAALAEEMERDIFEKYVEGVQTRIDNQTPPEMRWLVMFPKLSHAELGVLRGQFAVLGSIKPWLLKWLDGPLTHQLSALRLDPLAPVVLMIGRGRLMLRTTMPDPDLQGLQVWLRLFEAALREAQRTASGPADTGAAPSRHAGLWASSALPGDERK